MSFECDTSSKLILIIFTLCLILSHQIMYLFRGILFFLCFISGILIVKLLFIISLCSFQNIITAINKLDQCLLEGMQTGQMLIGLTFSLVAQSWSNMSKFWGDIIWYDISVNLPWWLCWIRIDRDSYLLHSSTLDLLDANDLASHAAILEIPGNFSLVFGHKSYLFIFQELCKEHKDVFYAERGWCFPVINRVEFSHHLFGL